MSDLTIEGLTPTWTLSDRLRKARETRGLSQGRLAELTGISKRSIQNYEAGTSAPKRPQLLAWAMATGVSLSWIALGGETWATVDPAVTWNDVPPDVSWADLQAVRGASNEECAVRDSNPEPADYCPGLAA